MGEKGIKVNKYSWNKLGHTLYIEMPFGVGFSYLNRSRDHLLEHNDHSVSFY